MNSDPVSVKIIRIASASADVINGYDVTVNWSKLDTTTLVGGLAPNRVVIKSLNGDINSTLFGAITSGTTTIGNVRPGTHTIQVMAATQPEDPAMPGMPFGPLVLGPVQATAEVTIASNPISNVVLAKQANEDLLVTWSSVDSTTRSYTLQFNTSMGYPVVSQSISQGGTSHSFTLPAYQYKNNFNVGPSTILRCSVSNPNQDGSPVVSNDVTVSGSGMF